MQINRRRVCVSLFLVFLSLCRHAHLGPPFSLHWPLCVCFSSLWPATVCSSGLGGPLWGDKLARWAERDNWQVLELRLPSSVETKRRRVGVVGVVGVVDVVVVVVFRVVVFVLLVVAAPPLGSSLGLTWPRHDVPSAVPPHRARQRSNGPINGRQTGSAFLWRPAWLACLLGGRRRRNWTPSGERFARLPGSAATREVMYAARRAIYI